MAIGEEVYSSARAGPKSSPSVWLRALGTIAFWGLILWLIYRRNASKGKRLDVEVEGEGPYGPSLIQKPQPTGLRGWVHNWWDRIADELVAAGVMELSKLIVLSCFVGSILLYVPPALSRIRDLLPNESQATPLSVMGQSTYPITPTSMSSPQWYCCGIIVIVMPMPDSTKLATPTPPPAPATQPTPTPTPSVLPATPQPPLPSPTAEFAVGTRCPNFDWPIPRGEDYIVQPGDTLSCIAARAGVRLQALVAANPQITNPDLIHSGNTIHIP